MNTEIKVSLTIELQGSTMLSKEECLKTTQKVIKKKDRKTGKVYGKSVMAVVEDWDKMNRHTMKVVDKGTFSEIVFYTRKSKPARQHVNICKSAYIHMTEGNNCPEWCRTSIWGQMSKIQRLEAHMDRIAQDMGGKVLSYKVFED